MNIENAQNINCVDPENPSPEKRTVISLEELVVKYKELYGPITFRFFNSEVCVGPIHYEHPELGIFQPQLTNLPNDAEPVDKAWSDIYFVWPYIENAVGGTPPDEADSLIKRGWLFDHYSLRLAIRFLKDNQKFAYERIRKATGIVAFMDVEKEVCEAMKESKILSRYLNSFGPLFEISYYHAEDIEIEKIEGTYDEVESMQLLFDCNAAEWLDIIQKEEFMTEWNDIIVKDEHMIGKSVPNPVDIVKNAYIKIQVDSARHANILTTDFAIGVATANVHFQDMLENQGIKPEDQRNLAFIDLGGTGNLESNWRSMRTAIYTGYEPVSIVKYPDENIKPEGYRIRMVCRYNPDKAKKYNQIITDHYNSLAFCMPSNSISKTFTSNKGTYMEKLTFV